MSDLRRRIEADADWLTAFRRDLHRHPELMFEEERTSMKVAEALAQAGIEHRAGMARGTGILGFLPATQTAARTVALRADMDALPILEETGLPHASIIPGKMHACGHDGHTTILVGAARALAQAKDRPHNILFVFQPAEEGGGGGNLMCQEGALDGSHFPAKADCIFGLHGWPAREEGAFSTKPGPLMASTDQFHVTLRGHGGHAAAPELSKDVIPALGQIITALQTLVSRNVAPVENAVLTIAGVRAGTATNIIPEHAEFFGTVRTLDMEVKDLMRTRFREVVEGIAGAMGVSAKIQYESGYPVTYNHEGATEQFFRVAREAFGDRVKVEKHPKLGAEDFSYYGHFVPAAFYFVGLAKPGEEHPPELHTPRFDFNDAVIPDCVEMMCRLATSPLDPDLIPQP